MKLLDLFSGIGGFSLAAERVWDDELEIVGFCEIDKYCKKILKKNFPYIPIYNDIKELNGNEFKEIDLITGGFPCQDISIAGRGAGIGGKRSGLWAEMHRIIGDVRPRFVLIENVPMLTIRGGTRVIADLAEIGYDAEWQIISAADVGACHLRKRIWVVAYPNDAGNRTSKRRIVGVGKKENEGRQGWTQSEFSRQSKDVADPVSELRGRRRAVRQGGEDGDRELYIEEEEQARYDIRSEAVRRSAVRGEIEFSDTDSTRRGERRWGKSVQETFDTTECNSERKIPTNWSAEPNVGRVAHGIPFRVDRLRGLGNAIVPQTSMVVMNMIKEIMELEK